MTMLKPTLEWPSIRQVMSVSTAPCPSHTTGSCASCGDYPADAQSIAHRGMFETVCTPCHDMIFAAASRLVRKSGRSVVIYGSPDVGMYLSIMVDVYPLGTREPTPKEFSRLLDDFANGRCGLSNLQDTLTGYANE